jgi:hypothetical protein
VFGDVVESEGGKSFVEANNIEPVKASWLSLASKIIAQIVRIIFRL